jgi:hypothetical protein
MFRASDEASLLETVMVTSHRHPAVKQMPEKRTSGCPKISRARIVRVFECKGAVVFAGDWSSEGESSMTQFRQESNMQMELVA